MTHEQQLNRVYTSISGLVHSFAKERLATKRPTFFIRDLHDYILSATQIAPASPDRILRQLRLNKTLDYRVLDRRASKYEMLLA